MKKSIIPAILAAFLLIPAFSANAQIKIGTVDMNQVFSSYYKTKDAESQINEARASAKKELDERVEEHKQAMETINKLNEDIEKPELSAEAKEQKQREREEKIADFKNLDREIHEFRTTREKQLQDQAVRMRNRIVEDIMKIVNDKVKSENYDIVFDRSGNSINGVAVVLYARDAMEFSQEVIKELNKSKPKGGAAAPAEDKAPAKPKQ